VYQPATCLAKALDTGLAFGGGREGLAMRRPPRLTGGGPTWDMRPRKARVRPPRKSPIPEADAAMALTMRSRT
jgi:hypothetical protein